MHFFPDPEPPAVNVLYEWSVIYGQFALFFNVFFCNIIKAKYFFIGFYILFYLLGSYSFPLDMFLLSHLIAFFYHHLYLKQSCQLPQ